MAFASMCLACAGRNNRRLRHSCALPLLHASPAENPSATGTAAGRGRMPGICLWRCHDVTGGAGDNWASAVSTDRDANNSHAYERMSCG